MSCRRERCAFLCRQSRKPLRPVSLRGKRLYIHKMRLPVFVVIEARKPEDPGAVGRSRVGAGFLDQRPLELLGLLLGKPLDFPDDLPPIRRGVDQVVRLRQIRAREQFFDRGCAVIVKVQVHVPNS